MNTSLEARRRFYDSDAETAIHLLGNMGVRVAAALAQAGIAVLGRVLSGPAETQRRDRGPSRRRPA